LAPTRWGEADRIGQHRLGFGTIMEGSGRDAERQSHFAFERGSAIARFDQIGQVGEFALPHHRFEQRRQIVRLLAIAVACGARLALGGNGITKLQVDARELLRSSGSCGDSWIALRSSISAALRFPLAIRWSVFLTGAGDSAASEAGLAKVSTAAANAAQCHERRRRAWGIGFPFTRLRPLGIEAKLVLLHQIVERGSAYAE
jgi:hypothetical protein